MAEVHRTRTFRSGNSTALRLPRALGFAEGDELTIVPHRDGSFSLFRTEQGKAAFMALSGSMSAGFMAEGRDGSGQPERDWRGPGTAEAA